MTISDQKVTPEDLMSAFYDKLVDLFSERTKSGFYPPIDFFETLHVEGFKQRRGEYLISSDLRIRDGDIACQVDVSGDHRQFPDWQPYAGKISGSERVASGFEQYGVTVSAQDLSEFINRVSKNSERSTLIKSETTEFETAGNFKEVYGLNSICKKCIPAHHYRELKVIDLDYKQDLVFLSLPLFLVEFAYKGGQKLNFLFSGTKDVHICECSHLPLISRQQVFSDVHDKTISKIKTEFGEAFPKQSITVANHSDSALICFFEEIKAKCEKKKKDLEGRLGGFSNAN